MKDAGSAVLYYINPESVAKSPTIPVQPIEIMGSMLHNFPSIISPGGDGMKRFIIEHSQGEFYSVHSGLALVGLVSEQVTEPEDARLRLSLSVR